MRVLMVLFVASMLVVSGSAAAYDRDAECDSHHRDRDFLRHCDVDWDEEEGLLTITNEDDDDEMVQISRKYVLTVNGERIELERRQKELVKDYYGHFKKLHEMAEEIGEEGAKLGAEGAKIAAVAMKRLCSLFGDDEDAEEFEEEIEREAEKIEAKAKKLEAKAEKLEEIADDLEDLHHDLKKAIPEIDALDWF